MPKILPTSVKPSKDISLRHMMAALTHTRSDTPRRQSNRTELQIHHVDPVSGLLPRLDPSCVRQTAARRLESKILPLALQSIDLPQQQSGGCNCRELRLQGRQAARDRQ
jgi:hypothetical protein